MTGGAAWLSALCRVGPVLMMAPPLGWAGVPLGLRAAVVAGLALCAAPMVRAAGPQVQPGALVGELALGLWLALVVSLPFWSLRVAGAVVETAADEEEPGEGRWAEAVYLLAAAAMVAVRGHAWLLAGLLGSYRAWPYGADVTAAGWDALARAATEMLGAGLVMALPLLAFAAVAQVVTALAGRAGVVATGLPVRPIVVALGLLAMVPLVGAAVSRELQAVLAFLASGGAMAG